MKYVTYLLLTISLTACFLEGKPGVQGPPGPSGRDGVDAPDSPYSPTGVVDPCGPSGTVDEVLLQLGNGMLLASFSSNINGDYTRLVLLVPGNGYMTTDTDNCIFDVVSDATDDRPYAVKVVNERH